MDPVQLVILRLGLYELIELGTSPHVISEHVDLAKALVFPQAAGFTNGGKFCRLLSCCSTVWAGRCDYKHLDHMLALLQQGAGHWLAGA